MEMDNSYYVGLDFGTCNLKAVSYVHGKNRIIKLNKDQNGKAYAPSIILYDKNKNGEIEKKIGMRAKKNPDELNKVHNIKKKLELKDWSKFIQNLGHDVDAPTVCQDIFTRIYNIIMENRPDTASIITTITVPVAFSEVQRRVIWTAAKTAGFDVRYLVTEPFAALFSQEDLFIDEEGEENVMIFDFGGATLDLSLIHIENDGNGGIDVTELSSVGMSFGGLDIDRLIYEEILKKKYPQEIEAALSADDIGIAEQELMEAAAHIKEIIFDEDAEEETKYTIPVRGCKSINVIVSQAEILDVFEQKGLAKKVGKLIDELFDAQDDVNPDEVTRVYPFGGSSMIAYFRKILDEKIDVFDMDDCEIDDDLYLAIAKGASTYTYFRENNENFTMKQSIPFLVGLLKDDAFSYILPKATPGYISTRRPLSWEWLGEHNDSVDLYQTFSNERELQGKSITEDSAFITYIGSFYLDRSKYDLSITPTYNMFFDRAGNLVIRTWQQMPEDDEPVQREELMIKMGVQP